MIVFDLDTYPLETATSFNPNLGTVVDQMDDLTFRLRQLTSTRPSIIRCAFSPLSEDKSASFETYLYLNAAEEIYIIHNGKTYAGYIDGGSVSKSVTDGSLHWWSFDFYGKAL